MQNNDTPFAERIHRATREAQARGLAALALVPGPNLRYLMGLALDASERLMLALLAPGRPPAFVVPSFEAERVRLGAGMPADVFPYTDEEGPSGALAQACQHLDLAGQEAGAESLHMRLMEYLRLREAGVDVVAADDIFTGARLRKDAAELAAMRDAIARTEQVLRDFLPQIQPGRTERELASRLQAMLLEASGEGLPFSPILVAGPNAALPHGTPSDRPIQKGDLVVIDCGMFRNGYVSDITRTFAVGHADAKLRRVYEAVLEANRAGKAACKPGVAAEEVDRAARHVIRDAGYGDFFTHRTGHGIGLELHEPPYMMEGNALVLEPGMTFTVEPGIYLPGRGGVRIEDDVVITAEGAESLTTFPRELMVL
ncbi:MAG: aminopeptidase P family protein [Anaerolineales bacterium]